MSSIHAMDYYSAIKRNEALTLATTWMSLANMMLSESSQSKKITYCMIPFMTRSEKANLWRQKIDQQLPRAGGGWDGGIGK